MNSSSNVCVSFVVPTPTTALVALVAGEFGLRVHNSLEERILKHRTVSPSSCTRPSHLR